MFFATRYTVDAAKTLRQSHILLRIFLCFDIFFLISATVNLIWFTPTDESDDDDKTGAAMLGNLRSQVLLSMMGFFMTSFMCNSLAIYGLSARKRGFLLPWLVFYSAVKILLILAFISNILHRPLNLDQLFLLLILMSVMSAWRHLQAQYILMGLPQASLVITDAEVAVVGSQTNARQNDLPPKYEDVAEIPPKYDEATMKPNEN